MTSKRSWTEHLWGNDKPEENSSDDWGGRSYDYDFDSELFTDDEDLVDAEKAGRDLDDIAAKGDKRLTPALLRKLKEGVENMKAKAARRSSGKSKVMEEYEKTGKWRGYAYYAPPRLDARYIEQVANMIAAKYDIEVRPGDGWHVDLKSKILTYDPETLLDGTKGRMLASLLHEAGHVRHTTPSNEIKSDYLVKYTQQAHGIVNVFEDMRIDVIMARSYASGDDIFAQNKPIVREIAEKYQKKAKFVRDTAIQEVEKYLAQFGIKAKVTTNMTGERFVNVEDWYDDKFCSKELIKDGANVIKAREKTFGNKKVTPELKAKIENTFGGIINMDTLEDYTAGILLVGYGEALPSNTLPKMKTRIETTQVAIPPIVKEESTQGVTTILDKDVYPVIEDLFKRDEQMQEMMQDLLGGLAKDLAKHIDKQVKAGMAAQGRRDGEGQPAKPGEMEARAGASNRGEKVPQEWKEGNYDALKTSVEPETDRLIRRLKLIKKEEDSPKYHGNKRRGKLASKQLHRFSQGSNRLFKKKEHMPKQVEAHAFSIVIDTSGSMYDARESIVHATRAAVMFGEVFKALEIPFEVIGFDSDATVFKDFDKPFVKSEQNKVAGIPLRSGGATNLDAAFAKSKILKQTRPSRTMIIISDGGVGDFRYYDKEKRKYEDENVKLVGISINSGPDIVRFCGHGEEVTRVAKLPDVFSRIMREAFKSKKRYTF